MSLRLRLGLLYGSLTAAVVLAIAASGGEGKAGSVIVRPGPSLYAPIDPVAEFDDSRKVRILETLERFARRADPRVKQVIGRLSGEYDVVLVARADGGVAAGNSDQSTSRSRTAAMVSVVVARA